jgi:hypothetical protein
LGLTGGVGYSVYQNQITKQYFWKLQFKTTAEQNSRNNFLYKPLPLCPLSERSKCRIVVAGAFREEKNAQKIFERLSKLGYKAKITLTNTVVSCVIWRYLYFVSRNDKVK